MNAPLKAVAGPGKSGTSYRRHAGRQARDKLDALMRGIAHDARDAARVLALAPPAQKNKALAAMAKAVRRSRNAILAANAEDQAEAKSGGATAAFLDRLSLDAERVEAMAAGLDVIRKLKDPVGTVMDSWRRPNGMRIERVRVPLGVIGVIYESRPNVTADAGALCLKAGNAAILRGGSESFRSCRAIHAALVEGLTEAGLPPAAITLVPTRDRDAVGMMLGGLDGAIDVIVPRGGKGLVERVQTEARVPVFAHLEGVCHVYVDRQSQARHGQEDRAQCQDAPHRRVRSGRDAAGRSRRRRQIPQTAGHHAARRRLRDPRRCRGPGRRPPRQAGERGRLEHRISRRHLDRRRGRRRR